MLVVEVLIDVQEPIGLPLPSSFRRQQDALLWNLVLSGFIRPVRPLSWEQNVLEDAHPYSLVLVSLELGYLGLLLMVQILHVN